MMQTNVLDIGAVTIELVDDGFFWIDAGAMFGVVPKAVWEKKVVVDPKNRIRLTCNIPLVRTDGRNILIDTGCGDKWDPKNRGLYSIDDIYLCDELLSHGVTPDEITDVILTHLHFDHAGGLTRWEDPASPGESVLIYPNAAYYVQKEEWDAAGHPDELDRRSYLEENLKPLQENGRLVLLEGDTEIIPGITVMRTGGHTLGHQAVRIQGNDAVMYHLGDLLPSTKHLRLTWLTAYDRDSYTALDAKRALLARVAEEDAYLWIEHDPDEAAVKIRPDDEGRGYEFTPLIVRNED